MNEVPWSVIDAESGLIDIFDCMQPDLRIAELTEKSDDPTVMQASRQATHRILYTVVNSSAMNGISCADKIVAITPWWKIALVFYRARAVTF